MNSPSLRYAATVVVAAAALIAGCSSAVTGEREPTVVHPGAPGEATRTVATADATTRPRHTEADVRFMQGMIAHHAQALEMTALVPERTERDDMRMLARRIEASQEDEIALMSRWLATRGEVVPDVSADHAHHGHHGHHGTHDALMPGMLTQEQLAQLAAATGDEFDRLFLELMIFHHEGALIMVEQLFATEGAGQETAVFEFASHVDSDQRMEILRMRRMLGASLQRGTE